MYWKWLTCRVDDCSARVVPFDFDCMMWRQVTQVPSGGLLSRFFFRGSLTPRFHLGPYVSIWLRDFVGQEFYRGSELGAPSPRFLLGVIYSVFFLRGSLFTQAPSGTLILYLIIPQQ